MQKNKALNLPDWGVFIAARDDKYEIFSKVGYGFDNGRKPSGSRFGLGGH